MFKSSEEFRNYIMEHSGIYYDSEAHQLYVNYRGVSATIDCPYEIPYECSPEDCGAALEEMAEDDEDVWEDLWWEYESDSDAMTLRELISGNPWGDDGIDVYENVCGWGIALCGSRELTAEAQERFASVLDAAILPTPVHYLGNGVKYQCVGVDLDYGDPEKNHECFRELMEALAGFCTIEEDERWFE